MADMDSILFTKEYFLQDNICRFCWTKDAMMNCTLKSPMFLKVEYCLNIDLSQDDSKYFPKKVCQDCVRKIEYFHEFKKFCQNANVKLNKIINNEIDIFNIEICPGSIEAEKFDANFDFLGLKEISAGSIKAEKVDDNFDFLGLKTSLIDNQHHLETSNKHTDKSLGYSNSSQNRTGPKSELIQETAKARNLLTSKPNPTSLQKSLDNVAESPTTFIRTKNLQQTKFDSIGVTIQSIGTKHSKSREEKCTTFCNICCEDFLDKSTFIKHNSEAHGMESNGKFRCFGCGKLYSMRSSRLRHESIVCKELENGYKCSICNKYLSSRGIYEKHMKNHRLNKVVELEGENIFSCNKCGKPFPKKDDWKAHMKEHASYKEYICETCGKVFQKRGNLISHITTHTGDKRYMCSQCEYRCSQKQSLTIHMRIHTKERPYQCDICPQRCVSSSNLLAHLRRHSGIKPFQCPYSNCDKKFGYKGTLAEHIAITHQGTASNPCPHCGLVYLRKTYLNKHLQKKHPGVILQKKKRRVHPNLNENILQGTENKSSKEKTEIEEDIDN